MESVSNKIKMKNEWNISSNFTFNTYSCEFSIGRSASETPLFDSRYILNNLHGYIESKRPRKNCINQFKRI